MSSAWYDSRSQCAELQVACQIGYWTVAEGISPCRSAVYLDVVANYLRKVQEECRREPPTVVSLTADATRFGGKGHFWSGLWFPQWNSGCWAPPQALTTIPFSPERKHRCKQGLRTFSQKRGENVSDRFRTFQSVSERFIAFSERFRAFSERFRAFQNVSERFHRNGKGLRTFSQTRKQPFHNHENGQSATTRTGKPRRRPSGEGAKKRGQVSSGVCTIPRLDPRNGSVNKGMLGEGGLVEMRG